MSYWVSMSPLRKKEGTKKMGRTSVCMGEVVSTTEKNKIIRGLWLTVKLMYMW